MLSALLLRVASDMLHSLMGGMCVFCLYYAAQLPDHDVVGTLILAALKWGACAAALLYYKSKYLES